METILKIGFRTMSIAILATLLMHTRVSAQTPMGSTPPPPPPDDTAIIFEPSQPLIKTAVETSRDYQNSWGFSGSFSDYGFAGGMYLSHAFDPNFAMSLGFDLGTAKGSREFDLIEEDKVNNIYVIPVMASAEYRLFRFGLSDNLRPYLSVGAGPVVVMTTPAALDFFPSFGQAAVKVIPGGYVGLGAKFGSDPKSTFGASLRYFFIPYPGSIESTTTQSLTDLSGLFLTVSYGVSF